MLMLTVCQSSYRTGVEQALLKANFLQTRDISVLQAFVLYLVGLQQITVLTMHPNLFIDM